MSSDPKKLLEDALKLPQEARAAIAGSLIDSLDERLDEDAEDAWSVEITRRLAEMDAGKVKTIPWPEARRRILENPDDPGQP
jgi:putative addiction module component (TIGR02574 family)